MTTVSDHRHGPWRAIAAVVHHTRHGEHATTVEVADAAEGPSIAAWLATGDRVPSGPERIPAMPPAMMHRSYKTFPADLSGVARMPGAKPAAAFPDSFDEDDAFSHRLNQMARLVHSTADRLAAENDRRAARLLNWSGSAVARSAATGVELAAWAGTRFQPMRVAAVAVRRRARNVRQTRELGHLLVDGNLPPEAVVRAMVRRSLHATNPAEDSATIPRLTPPVLAELDRTLGMRRPQAPGSTVAA